ncbi:hypothetical protein E4U49_006351 [Claviceps purpurea]|nr:hypothetical protein E4U49_006351 [Claviceps purpurea]
MDSRPHNSPHDRRTRPQGSPAVLGAPPVRRVRGKAPTLERRRPGWGEGLGPANAPAG